MTSTEIVLEPADNHRLANLCGQFNEHLTQIEHRLGVDIRNRGEQFHIEGPNESVQKAVEVISDLFQASEKDELTPAKVHLFMQSAGIGPHDPQFAPHTGHSVRTRRKLIQPRGANQKHYVNAIANHDVVFGIGPAGTGKTYLAVAAAVEALEAERVRRLILARPAVEAGERLGFLPGDLSQKIDPYLRPLYDALYEMLGVERVARLIEKNIIEVAPLAFMRGRTLNDAFIILDEAQNTTPEQIKMFLTRIGFGSTAVITGDITQIDLPRGSESGLKHVMKVLADIEGIHFQQFSQADVVRHPIVQRIVTAYARFHASDER